MASGVPLTLIVGNHDLGITFGSVHARLAEALGPGTLTVYPWFVFQAGRVYAEHGHQHHDINALLRPLKPMLEGAPRALEAPLAVVLEAGLRQMRATRSPGTGASVVRAGLAWAELGSALTAHLARLSSRARRRLRSRYRRTVLPSFAPAIGLPPELLVALDQISNPSAAGIVSRLAVKAARGLLARPRDGAAGTRWSAVAARDASYLLHAAATIDSVLARDGRGVPNYVFGHSHLGESKLLPSGAHYLNPGAWGDDTDPGRRYQFVFIPSSTGAAGLLMTWDDEAGEIRSTA